jgi:hypothetical protein
MRGGGGGGWLCQPLTGVQQGRGVVLRDGKAVELRTEQKSEQAWLMDSLMRVEAVNDLPSRLS